MRLRKWYLDFHAEDETGFYYIMSLHTGIFKVGASGIYHVNKNREIRSFKFSRLKNESLHSLDLSRSSLNLSFKKAQLKTCHGSINLEGEWRNPNGPIKRVFKPLFRQGKNWCDWKVWMPAAEVNLKITAGHRSKNLKGKGYMDFIGFSLPPWNMPFHKLYWGRLHSDNNWIILNMIQSKDRTISVYYENGNHGQEAQVEVEKDSSGNITAFNWLLGPPGKRKICAEVVSTLEVQEVINRAALSLLPARLRRILGSAGVDKKFVVRAQLAGCLYRGIMEEVTWHA